jgi:hypothetical protein
MIFRANARGESLHFDGRDAARETSLGTVANWERFSGNPPSLRQIFSTFVEDSPVLKACMSMDNKENRRQADVMRIATLCQQWDISLALTNIVATYLHSIKQGVGDLDRRFVQGEGRQIVARHPN